MRTIILVVGVYVFILFSLLSRHAVRAIRGTKTARCKVYSSESGLYCDLYHPDERCDGCKGLQGVIFYPLGPDYLENIELDPDIKELWHKVDAHYNLELCKLSFRLLQRL